MLGRAPEVGVPLRDALLLLLKVLDLLLRVEMLVDQAGTLVDALVDGAEVMAQVNILQWIITRTHQVLRLLAVS